jgi:predicted transcriptional regulator
MSTLSLRLPESIHQKLGELAEREGISINQLINSAVAEKLAALLTEQYLAERATRADRSKFDAVLAKISDVPPLPGDELPSERATPRRPANQEALQRTGPPRESAKDRRSTRRRPRR